MSRIINIGEFYQPSHNPRQSQQIGSVVERFLGFTQTGTTTTTGATGPVISMSFYIAPAVGEYITIPSASGSTGPYTVTGGNYLDFVISPGLHEPISDFADVNIYSSTGFIRTIQVKQAVSGATAINTCNRQISTGTVIQFATSFPNQNAIVQETNVSSVVNTVNSSTVFATTPLTMNFNGLLMISYKDKPTVYDINALRSSHFRRQSGNHPRI